MGRFKLTVLIVVFDMPREAPRTIVSALPPYQKGVGTDDYEILILDNGSNLPLPDQYVRRLPTNVRCLRVPSPTVSPGDAINWGVTQAAGDCILVCIDGARILSDRLVSTAIKVMDEFPDAFIYTLSWHLGPDVQMRSMFNGYDQGVEDELLAQADWTQNPDKLFEISVLAASSARGIAGPINESNVFAVRRKLLDTVGGYDTRFKLPGGSSSNLELFKRYVTRPNALNICLQSEGSFHQFHDGAATGNPGQVERMMDEYAEIFGDAYRRPDYMTLFYGWPRRAASDVLATSLTRAR